MSIVSNIIKKAGHSISAEAEKLLDEVEKHPDYLLALLGPAGIAADLGYNAVKNLGGGRGLFGGGGGKSRPKARPPHKDYSCGYDPQTGLPSEGREPFTFKSRLQLAAGAQSATADLGDFFTTAATSDLTTNNQFPFTYDVDLANLVITANNNLVLTALVETIAVLNGLKLIERKFNSQEQWQYGPEDFGALFTAEGTHGTASATVAVAARNLTYDMTDPWVDYEMRYVANEQWQMAIRNIRAFTSVGLVDLTLSFKGHR